MEVLYDKAETLSIDALAHDEIEEYGTDLYDNENSHADTLSINTLALEEIEQHETNRENAELEKLREKVYFIHTSLLYMWTIQRQSKPALILYEVRKNIIMKVGGTASAFMDFGGHLGIPQNVLDYINVSLKEDPVDTVLKVFMQERDATMDKIVQAFIDMRRYDILRLIKDSLIYISNYVKDEMEKRDSGFISNSRTSESMGKRNIVTIYHNLAVDLPPLLNKEYIKKRNPRIKALEPVLNQEKNNSPILFLTFAQDGWQTANKIQTYVSNWSEFQDTTIIILESMKERVHPNPEKFIREYFEKADFVVPIITPEYLKAIKSNNPSVPSTTENLDFQYVNFIYTLIVNNYVHATGCLNNKVRSVLPQVDVGVLRKVTMYPDLLPWTYEANFNEQFQAFLRRLRLNL